MISKLLALLVVLVTLPVDCRANGNRFLKAQGNEIRDAKGQVIHLRGVNLGGWLLFEPWMCPMDRSGLKDDNAAREVLTERFGASTAESLIRTYQENWITTGDLDKIAAYGMNVIRVPFWYRNLQTEEGDWIPDGMERLDWVVREAWKRGIYTIIDLHGAPGGQTRGESVGKHRQRAELWTNEQNIIRTCKIWEKVAGHFKGNPGVAAYDLLNEPSDAPSLGALWSLYDRLYQAVRAVDPDHIITVEGCINARIGEKDINWGWDALPHPDHFGWRNVLYQMHHYEWDWSDAAKQRRGADFQVEQWRKHRSYGVPALIGEFNFMAREDAWDYGLAAFNEAGLHWSFWSYKAIHGTGSDSWGIYNPIQKGAPNLLTDDLKTIRAKWKSVETDTSFALNPMMDRVLKKALSPPAQKEIHPSP